MAGMANSGGGGDGHAQPHAAAANGAPTSTLLSLTAPSGSGAGARHAQERSGDAGGGGAEDLRPQSAKQGHPLGDAGGDVGGHIAAMTPPPPPLSGAGAVAAAALRMPMSERGKAGMPNRRPRNAEGPAAPQAATSPSAPSSRAAGAVAAAAVCGGADDGRASGHSAMGGSGAPSFSHQDSSGPAVGSLPSEVGGSSAAASPFPGDAPPGGRRGRPSDSSNGMCAAVGGLRRASDDAPSGSPQMHHVPAHNGGADSMWHPTHHQQPQQGHQPFRLEAGAGGDDPTADAPATSAFEAEAEGTLLGVQDLPTVGAAGVLVLPQRPATATGSGAASSSGGKRPEVADLGGISLDFIDANTDVLGWGPECEKEVRLPFRLLDATEEERSLVRYICAETGNSPTASASAAAGSASGAPSPRDEQPDIEQVRALAAEAPVMKPKEGPGLLQLAKDPRRREECPVCAAEWSQALRQLNIAVECKDNDGEADKMSPASLSRRFAPTKKSKMHSLRCNWLWFQQSLSTPLCALRFDETGDPRPRPGSPSSVLPPAMYDVWHYWRQKSGGRGDREHGRAAATERLVRGEPAG